VHREMLYQSSGVGLMVVGLPAQEDGPFWYFRGVPLVLDVFPGISGGWKRSGGEEKYRSTRGHGGRVTLDQVDH
jgi:hypothetical protein